jgi:predicted transcriptional regulator
LSMDDKLLYFILSSEKRENIIFLLLKKPLALAEVQGYFGVSSPEILPRLKELETKNIISKDRDGYHLTSMGRVIGKKLLSMVKVFHVIEENGKFLSGHDLTPIPEAFLDRIGELGKCERLESHVNMSEIHDRLVKNLSSSRTIKGISCIFDHGYPELFLRLKLNGAAVSIIMTKNVYDMTKKEHAKELKTFLGFEGAKLYYVEEDVKMAMVAADNFLSMSLYRDERFDSQNNLMSVEKSAVKWGDELFEYYRRKAIEVKG